VTHLESDLDRLSSALWEAVEALGGKRVVERARGLGDEAKRLRERTLDGGRRAFAAHVSGLDGRDLEDVARVYTQWCHLMNVAEEQQRIRVLRARPVPPDGLVAAVDAMAEAGMTGDDVRALFARALVMPVITAHPTEARRRSMIDHLFEIANAIDEIDDPGGQHRWAAEHLAEETLSLHATETTRPRNCDESRPSGISSTRRCARRRRRA
jgi:phosphoenolpyruvate carboxylase